MAGINFRNAQADSPVVISHVQGQNGFFKRPSLLRRGMFAAERGLKIPAREIEWKFGRDLSGTTTGLMDEPRQVVLPSASMPDDIVAALAQASAGQQAVFYIHFRQDPYAKRGLVNWVSFDGSQLTFSRVFTIGDNGFHVQATRKIAGPVKVSFLPDNDKGCKAHIDFPGQDHDFQHTLSTVTLNNTPYFISPHLSFPYPPLWSSPSVSISGFPGTSQWYNLQHHFQHTINYYSVSLPQDPEKGDFTAKSAELLFGLHFREGYNGFLLKIGSPVAGPSE